MDIEDTLRTPEEFIDDGLHEPVELVHSDKFQRIQLKVKDRANER